MSRASSVSVSFESPARVSLPRASKAALSGAKTVYGPPVASTVRVSPASSTAPANEARSSFSATRSASVMFAGSSPGVTFPAGATIIPSGTTMTTPCMGVRCVEALSVQPYGYVPVSLNACSNVSFSSIGPESKSPPVLVTVWLTSP